MATGVEVREIKFYNQLHNGSTFLLNPTNYSTTLKGNVGDKVQFTAKIGVYYEAELQSYSLINNTTYVVINMEGVNFISVCGFSLGDYVRFARPVETSPGSGIYNPSTFDGNITYLDENKVEIEFLSGFVPPSGQYDGATGFYAHVLLGMTAPESSIYSFCINENDDPFNEFSIIDNTLQAWYNEVIVSVFNDGTWKDTLKGQKNGGFRIKSDSATPRDIRFINYDSVHNYIVQHEFILPYWREDEDTNLEDSIPIDDLLGTKSYKYAFKIDLRTVLSNATTSKSAIFENLKGSVGYFDESFNGFSEYYSFSNLVLTDLSNSQTVQSLIANGQTKVNFRVSTTKANFTNTHKIVVGHSYLGLEDEYSKTKTDFETNFMYDTLRLTCGVGASSSLIINNATCTYVDASNIDVEFTIDYPTNYESRLSDTTEFVLWCDVSDLTFYDTSDKIKLKLLYGQHSKDSDVLGLANCEVINFFPHTVDLNMGSGFGDYKGFVEDGVGLGFRLQINDIVESVDRMQFKLLSINSSTSEQMELFNRDLDKDTLVKSSGVWVGGYSKGLGYNLNSQDDLNEESLIKVGSNVVGLDVYSVFDYKTAVKIPYQTWISNNNIDLSFFDNTKPNNNLNYLSSNYDTGNWELKACIEMDLVYGDSTTTYQILSPELIIKDFAESDDYEMNIRTFTEGFVSETFGTILKNQNTVIRAEVTQLSGDFTDLTGVWGVIRIEEKDSQGFNNHELSSVVASYDENPLIPLDGEMTAKLEIDSGKIYLTCRTDYSLLANVNYRISARLGINTALSLGAYSIGYSDGYN